MDLGYQIQEIFKEHPAFLKAKFRYSGHSWYCELSEYPSGLYIFICKEDEMQGQKKLECTEKEFLNSLMETEILELTRN